MRDIAIYGAGGLGREIACVLKKINMVTPTWNLLGFFADGLEVGTKNEYGEVLGGMNVLNSYIGSLALVIGIANPVAIQKIVSNIMLERIEYPNIISPDVKYMDENNYSIGKGNFINVGCLLSCHVRIGDFNNFGAFSTIGHDTQIGSYNVIMPSTQICGCVSAGYINFFGISSIVLQGLNVGHKVTIGCHSVLMTDAKSEYTYFRNPAKTIIKK